MRTSFEAPAVFRHRLSRAEGATLLRPGEPDVAVAGVGIAIGDDVGAVREPGDRQVAAGADPFTVRAGAHKLFGLESLGTWGPRREERLLTAIASVEPGRQQSCRHSHPPGS